MLQVTLYTKDECSLCDVVKAELAMLGERYPHELREVDITADPDTFLKYRYLIPVVEIGETRLKAPITAVDLAQALGRAFDLRG